MEVQREVEREGKGGGERGGSYLGENKLQRDWVLGFSITIQFSVHTASLSHSSTAEQWTVKKSLISTRR